MRSNFPPQNDLRNMGVIIRSRELRMYITYICSTGGKQNARLRARSKNKKSRLRSRANKKMQVAGETQNKKISRIYCRVKKSIS